MDHLESRRRDYAEQGSTGSYDDGDEYSVNSDDPESRAFAHFRTVRNRRKCVLKEKERQERRERERERERERVLEWMLGQHNAAEQEASLRRNRIQQARSAGGQGRELTYRTRDFTLYSSALLESSASSGVLFPENSLKLTLPLGDAPPRVLGVNLHLGLGEFQERRYGICTLPPRATRQSIPVDLEIGRYLNELTPEDSPPPEEDPYFVPRGVIRVEIMWLSDNYILVKVPRPHVLSTIVGAAVTSHESGHHQSDPPTSEFVVFTGVNKNLIPEERERRNQVEMQRRASEGRLRTPLPDYGSGLE